MAQENLVVSRPTSLRHTSIYHYYKRQLQSTGLLLPRVALDRERLEGPRPPHPNPLRPPLPRPSQSYLSAMAASVASLSSSPSPSLLPSPRHHWVVSCLPAPSRRHPFLPTLDSAGASQTPVTAPTLPLPMPCPPPPFRLPLFNPRSGS
jgi:hypothetical protein